MTTQNQHLSVDPELRPAIALLPDLHNLGPATLPPIRDLLSGTPAKLGDDGTVTVSIVNVPGPDGSDTMECLLYVPNSRARKPGPALVHIHGGGFIAGSMQRDDEASRLFARTLGCVVLAPEYRLAPEHPFPAPMEDCYAALQWLHAHADELAVDPARVALRGISAGGGLAMGLALLARDRGALPLCHVQLIYPMLDDRTGLHAHTGKYVWTEASNAFGWDSYLKGQDRAKPSPYAIPGRADDYTRLPPVFMAIGAIDLFAGECLRLAEQLVDVGNAVELHLYPRAYHGFSMVTQSRVAQAMQRDCLDSMRCAFLQS